MAMTIHSSKKNNQEKQKAGATVDVLGCIVRNGFALVAHRDDQRAEVVDRAHDNAADKYPQQRRHPSPDDGDGRTDNGAGAGDRGEMVAENDLLLGGDIIDPVFERD
jgi:hypothetical protein